MSASIDAKWDMACKLSHTSLQHIIHNAACVLDCFGKNTL